MEGVRNGSDSGERTLNLGRPRAGRAGGKLKPLLRAWARKDSGARTELSCETVCLHCCLCRARGDLHPPGALRLQQGLRCLLMLFSGWIIFGEFKAGLSCVSGLASGMTHSDRGDMGTGRSAGYTLKPFQRGLE